MTARILAALGLLTFIATLALAADPAPLAQEANTWVKRSPLKDGPPSPSLGYEGSMGYDPVNKVVIRWAGHNQGGGGEQNGETWTFDPVTAKWTIKEPDTSPPGACCNNQNVFDPVQNRFVRFSAFSGSHGWHWFRENYLSNSSVWTYDLASNTWRDMRPLPAPRVSPLRCASWDTDHQVIVVFGGEGNQEGTVVYDPYTNTWTRKNPKVQPAWRSGGNMVYDQARKLHILFGAQFTDDPHTWAYDLDKNEWRDLKPEKMPPTDRNDPVMAYDPLNQVVIAVVQVVDKSDGKEVAGAHHETWAFDAGKNTWTKMNPSREPDGWGNRRRVMIALPDQNLILMEMYVNPTLRVAGVEREQQIWTYRYAGSTPNPIPKLPAVPARKQPRLVEDAVVAVVSAKEVKISWKPPTGDVTGYHVERAPVEVFSEDQLIRLKKDTQPLEEPSVGGVKAIGKFVRLTKAPIKETAFMDSSVDLAKAAGVDGDPLFVHRFGKEQIDEKGKPYGFGVYAYRVIAVNALQVESGPSPYFLTIPSSPKWVFSKEDGDDCQLKWQANAEQNVKGYRVYRMESPRINGAGQKCNRLTAEPLKETRYTDAKIGKDTRRYWIVAVDALGQEGTPSAPVWHYREWRRFYTPFVGEWHQ
ncbi:hypothetical protein AYO44_06260 [Planctomycetaceae bacterium SCGC AG-212-F19]|nr:hypothetical protein AYO44_06260 [Planctomycetaceae bacterium SCGC AG-212-F19]